MFVVACCPVLFITDDVDTMGLSTIIWAMSIFGLRSLKLDAARRVTRDSVEGFFFDTFGLSGSPHSILDSVTRGSSGDG